jgi:hypothetical protein
MATIALNMISEVNFKKGEVFYFYMNRHLVNWLNKFHMERSGPQETFSR